MIEVAIIGTQGVPASYGGFESLVENMLGENCPPDIHYTVFCSSADMGERMNSYKGADLKYVRLHANGAQSIPYDMVSMCRALRGYDVILVLGVSGCLFMPLLRRITKARIIVNIDGLEHRREKWGMAARRLLKASEAMAVKHADIIVADNKGIQDYVTETYHRPSELIAYGGDQALRDVSEEKRVEILERYGLTGGRYGVTVCRIEPENNSHIILKAFENSDKDLVFIGNWNHSEWSRQLRARYAGCPNIHMLDAIYDLDTLYTIRSNAGLYIHGHSAGGTNPSLVEAMHFGIPIATWDVVYNRETTEGKACYFSSPEELNALAHARDDEMDGSPMLEIARRRYTWKLVAEQYCELFRRKD